MMTYDEWVELVNKSTSCDMVLAILKDWKEERKKLTDKINELTNLYLHK